MLVKQTSFGWLVAADIFLSGTGAGLFLTGFFLNLLNLFKPLAKLATIIGPLLVLAGTFFLFIDLGSKRNLWRLFSNPSSWLSRGTVILSVFLIAGFGYSLPSYDIFFWLPWNNDTGMQIIGIIAALFSFLVMIYTGILLAVLKGVPFWNTPALPILFLFSSLSTGAGCLLIIVPFMIKTFGSDISVAIHHVGIVVMGLTFGQLIVLWIYLEISRYRGLAAMESVRTLKRPIFIFGGVIIGIVLPLALLGLFVFMRDIFILSSIGAMAGIFLLIGGIVQRYSIIKAGIYP